MIQPSVFQWDGTMFMKRKCDEPVQMVASVPPNVEHVMVADSVTRIPVHAFFLHHRLQSIVIPSSVTTIGEYAFQGCSSLRSIDIPASVTRIGM